MFMYLIYNHYNSTTYQVKHQQCIWAYTHICTKPNSDGVSHFLAQEQEYRNIYLTNDNNLYKKMGKNNSAEHIIILILGI